jgi:hypothetical protein
VTDYPEHFEPKEKLAIKVRLPMVSLTFTPWTESRLEHGFGNKPLVNHRGEGMFAELAICCIAKKADWDARWVCTYGARRDGPRYLTSWSDVSLDEQQEVPLDQYQDALLAKIATENHGSYSGCWDVLAWKGERTLFIEAKHDGKDHIRTTQLQWRWAALRAGLTPESFVVAQWEFR